MKMNSKRIGAIILCLIIILINALIPKRENEDFKNTFDNMLSDKSYENIIKAGTNGKILKLSLEGVIADDGKNYLQDNSNSYSVLIKSLDRAISDDEIRGVYFFVNSPGGGVYESSEIRKRILKLKEKNIPIYVQMGTICASGGVYITSDADKIYAHPETLTGSIGVIMQSMNFSGLMEKYGVKAVTVKSGKNKDMLSPYKEPSSEELEIVQDFINSSYDRFVDIVANGRELSKEEVKKFADGRIYSAQKALEYKMIDKIGDEEDSLNALTHDNHLEDASIIEYSYNSLPFLDFLKYIPNEKSDLESIKSIISSRENADRPFMIYGGI